MNSNTTAKDWTIDMIKSMTEQEAKELSCSSSVIKEHNVYFIDFGGRFGYSYCVFRGGYHIHYANDYALLHPSDRSREKLHADYLKALDRKLFTESEAHEWVENHLDADEYIEIFGEPEE